MIRIKKWKRKMLFFIAFLAFVLIVLAIVFNQFLYSLLFFLGYSEVYKGNDERGNKLMMYSISKLKNPDAKLYHALSVQNTKNGNYDIAISALEKSYQLNPKESGEYYGWVLLYYYHDYEKALEILNKCDEATPNFSDAPMGECIHYLKGLAYAQLEDYENAIKEFDISIENTSSNQGEEWVDYQVFLNKGIALYRKRKFKDSINTLKKAISNYDKCTEAYYYIGLAQLELNIKDSACINISKAHSLIKQGYKSSDMYVELFHELYEQEIEISSLKYCTN